MEVSLDGSTDIRKRVLHAVAPDHDWMVGTALTLLTERIKDRSPRPGRELVAPFRLIARESTN